MLLETLVWGGFAGPSRLEDEDLAAVVQSQKLASTMALRLDSPAFRRAMNLEKEPLCDGLFWGVALEEHEKEPMVHFLFVEFKGRGIAHGVEQLASAIRVFRTHLESTVSELALGRTRFSAVVVSDRASPSFVVPKDAIRKFQREFRSALYVRSAQRRGASIDLSKDLWGHAREVLS